MVKTQPLSTAVDVHVAFARYKRGFGGEDERSKDAPCRSAECDLSLATWNVRPRSGSPSCSWRSRTLTIPGFHT